MNGADSGNRTLIGFASDVQGEAFVLLPDGTRSALKAGGAVYLNDQVIANGGTVLLQLINNQQVSVDGQTSTILNKEFLGIDFFITGDEGNEELAVKPQLEQLDDAEQIAVLPATESGEVAEDEPQYSDSGPELPFIINREDASAFYIINRFSDDDASQPDKQRQFALNRITPKDEVFTLSNTDNASPVIDPAQTPVFSTSEGGTVSITAAELLVGVTDDTTDTPTILSVDVPPEQGTVTQGDDGQWIYTPAPDFSGEAEISFEVSDGTQTTTGTTTVTVTNTDDDAPVIDPARLPTFSGSEGGTIEITEEALLAGVSDDTTETPTILSVDVPPEQGTVTRGDDGQWIYTPAPDFNGEAEISFEASDGTQTTTGTTTVTVTNTDDDAPVIDPAQVPTFSGSEGGTIEITEEALLAGVSDDTTETPTILSVDVPPEQGTV
ncbi:cadherin-like domain-containing protein, partial [Endozoicomonas sp.]|uniref:cadherin-like domain-containing protein n=1 Tax=Endozoicomonas sp. TaxID=1892382 RepID=UPI00383AFBC9